MLIRVDGGPLSGLDLRVSPGDERIPGRYVYKTMLPEDAVPEAGRTIIDVSGIVPTGYVPPSPEQYE